MPSNTLGLDGDLDDVAMLEDIEEAFMINISESDASRLRTVGDIYALLQSHFADNTMAEKCAAAMAFYRLRAALVKMGADKMTLKPETNIQKITLMKAKKFFNSLKAATDLRMPKPLAGRYGLIGVYSILAGFASLVCMIFPALQPLWALPATLIVSGLFLCRIDNGKFPQDLTLAELSKKVAGMNAGKLIAEGAAPSREYIWNALLVILTEHTTLPPSEITLETTLLISHQQTM